VEATSPREPARQAVTDAEAAARALARLERAAGSGELDRQTVAAVVCRIESGGHSLVGLLRRLVQDLGLDDDSPEAPHLRAAGEHARNLVVSLGGLDAVISDRHPSLKR
jgi:hypothetical protein